MRYEDIRATFGVHVHRGMRVTLRGVPGTVIGLQGNLLRILTDDPAGADTRAVVHPLSPALAYPPPARSRVRISSDGFVHRSTPHLPPVWPLRTTCGNLPDPARALPAPDTTPVTCPACLRAPRSHPAPGPGATRRTNL